MRSILALLLVACLPPSDPDVDPTTDPVPASPPVTYVSDLCPDIDGVEAVAWDLYNGVPVTDPAVVPPPFPDGPQFIHPTQPLLGFVHPAGWTATPLADGFGTVGVDLIRDDGRAIYRYVTAVLSSPFTVAQVVDVEVQSSRDFFGLTGPGEVVCSNQVTAEVTPGTGIIAEVDRVLVRIDGRSILVDAVVVQVPGVLPSVFIRLLSAPTPEWEARLLDTFIAIDWQLMVGDPDALSDRDGDGTPDVFDPDPDDPNVR